MKLLLTIVLSAIVFAASAQWTNTSNTFKDSLATAVTVATSNQQNPIVLTSYPDGGYFVVWEDDRNSTTSSTDIYAQKYDKNGNRLWTVNGIAIASSQYRDHFTTPSNGDYRTKSYMATDSSGGFYIAYSSDSVSTYTWERLTVQHVRSNGSNVFNGGYILQRSNTPNGLMAAQLIPDGNTGFFIGYKTTSGNDYVNLYCYRDEGGVLKNYGGGRANENATITSSIAPCGIKTDLVFPGTTVYAFSIWSDQNGGCNVVMDMNGNGNGQGRMLGVNRLWRAKKDCVVRVYRRNSVGSSCPRTIEYQKDYVSFLYILQTDFQSVHCTSIDGSVAYAYTNYRVISNGFALLDNQGYDYNYPKGITLASSGKINADVIAVTRRTYANNTVSANIIYGYAYAIEKFDSIPYQRSSSNNPDLGYNPTPNVNLEKMNYFRDTLIGTGTYYPDFSLSGGGDAGLGQDAYIGSMMDPYGARTVKLQHLKFLKQNADSFSIDYAKGTDNPVTKTGVSLGAEISTGFSGYNIAYDIPQVAVNKYGTALFYIGEAGRSIRISPITGRAKLMWGAMGRTISYGVFNNSYYNTTQGTFVFDNSTYGDGGFMAWKDSRYLGGGVYTYDDIYMRHIDSVYNFIYTPPIGKILPLTTYATTATANPAVLYGTSKVYTLLEVSSINQLYINTPLASVLDSNYLGRVILNVYEKAGAARVYNRQPYLNRNFTFLPDSFPPNARYYLKLYITKEQFDNLKTADPSIKDFSYLQVLRQPNTTATAPDSYAPVTGEEVLVPTSIDSLDGGYSINITANGLGNFFIQKIQSSNLCAAGNTSFTSNLTGTSYQWQVNTGSGFTNISNGGNYAGVTTATLQITNVPAAFNGYRYRCVVNGALNSNIYFLGINNQWTGAVNNLWENVGNWSCGKVPDATTDVVIKSGNITINSAAVCRSLTVSPSVNITVNPGFSLNVVH